MATDGGASDRERLWANVTFPIIVTMLVLGMVGLALGRDHGGRGAHRDGRGAPQTALKPVPGPTETMKPPGGPVEPCTLCALARLANGTPIPNAVAVVSVKNANDTWEPYATRVANANGNACVGVSAAEYRISLTLPSSGYSFAGIEQVPSPVQQPIADTAFVTTDGTRKTYDVKFKYTSP